MLSLNAVLTVNPPAAVSSLMDLDFGMGQTQSYKVGFAAIGQTTNDFWNYYTRDDGNGGYRTFGVLSNLALVNGTVTAVGMTIANAPGGRYGLHRSHVRHLPLSRQWWQRDDHPDQSARWPLQRIAILRGWQLRGHCGRRQLRDSTDL